MVKVKVFKLLKVKIYFKYQLPDECICFLEKVNEVIISINTTIEYGIG